MCVLLKCCLIIYICQMQYKYIIERTEIASKGHFLGQIPQPIHKVSEMKAIFEVGSTSIQNLPTLRNP